MDYIRPTSKDLAALFGTDEPTLSGVVGYIIEDAELDFRVLEGQDRDDIILDIVSLLDSGNLSASGPHRNGDWESGWTENLNEFIASGFDPVKLLPKYYNKDRPCRMNNQLVLGKSCRFMYAVSDIFRRWLYSTYFSNCESLHEFGCGTGHNLLVLGEMFPEATLWGYDWAKTSQMILDKVRDELRLNIHGRHFDFFEPDQEIVLGAGAGVLTFGALEQVSDRYGTFLETVLDARPEICVHVEGIAELYDKSNLLDYLAFRYHQSRNYLDGYLTALRNLAEQGKIEIIAEQRMHFGNLFDDPYSYVVWKPV